MKKNSWQRIVGLLMSCSFLFLLSVVPIFAGEGHASSEKGSKAESSQTESKEKESGSSGSEKKKKSKSEGSVTLSAMQKQMNDLEKTLSTYTAQQTQLMGEVETLAVNQAEMEEEQTKPESLRPNLLISGFSFGGDSVTAGKEFTLAFTLRNTSQNLGVRNIVITLGGENFVLASGTDTIYLDSIGAGHYTNQSMKFTTALDVETGSYPISATISYEYYDNNQKMEGSSELTMSIPVYQKDKVTVTDAGFAYPELYEGEEAEVSFNVINSGFTTLYNATAQIVRGKKVIESVYLGNIEPGSQMSSNGTLFMELEEAGEIELTLRIVYENEKLKKKKIDTPFTGVVEGAFEDVEEYPDEEIVVDDGPNVIKYVIIGAVALVVVAGAVTAFLLIRRKKKKKAELESELDDEDF